MLPDEFEIKVGPNDEKSPVPVSVHISVDDKVLAFGGFALLTLLVYARIKTKRK